MALAPFFLLLGLFELALGLLVILRRDRARMHWLFFGLSVSLAGWSFSWLLFTGDGNPFWIRLAFLWGSLIASGYLLVSLYFLSPARVDRRLAALLAAFVAATGLLATTGGLFVARVVALTDFGYESVPGPLQLWWRMALLVLIVAAIAILALRIRRSASLEERSKLRWVFGGTLVFAVFAVGSSVLGPLLLGATNITGFGPVSALPYTIGFALAVVKARIADVHAVFVRGTLRAMTIAVLVAALAFALAQRPVIVFLAERSGPSLVLALWALIGVVWLYVRYVVVLVDRAFRRRGGQSRTDLAGYRARLAEAGDTVAVLAAVHETLAGPLGYTVVATDEPRGRRRAHAALGALFTAGGGVLERDFLLLDPAPGPGEREALDLLAIQDADLVLPIAFGRELFAVLFLRRPGDRRPLSTAALAALDSVRTEAGHVLHRIGLMRRLATSEAKGIYARELEEKNRLLTARQRELERDMELARRIQQVLIPKAAPELAGLRLARRFLPLDKVAGDFYDFFPVGPGRLGVFVGDVSGHGVPSAFIAAMSRALLTAAPAAALGDPARLLGWLDERLSRHMAGFFLTACYGVLDLPRGRFTWASAAHPFVVHLPPQGPPEQRSRSGPAIGIVRGARYRNVSCRVRPGSRLVIYTDGCYEVYDGQDSLYEEERLLAFFAAAAPETPLEELADGFLAGLRAFANGTPFQDDLTLLLLELD